MAISSRPRGITPSAVAKNRTASPAQQGNRTYLLVTVGAVVLITLCIAVMAPRRMMARDDIMLHGSEQWLDSAVHGMGLSLGDLVNRTKYAVVIDCGSSGSRLHAYSFTTGAVGVDVIDELFVPIKPGLGKYAGQPVEGAASLQPLIDAALKYVPRAQHAVTRMVIGATAGLRVLPGSEADDLLNAVRKLALRTEFVISPAADVFVMSGSAEGAYAWLAINFLLKRIGTRHKGAASPVSVMDLGGGSVQMVRALGSGRQPEGVEGHPVATGSGKSDRVFVHSFLGLGLLASRMAVLESPIAAACVPKGAESSFSFHGRTVQYGGDSAAPDVAVCAELVKVSLNCLILTADNDIACESCSCSQLDSLTPPHILISFTFTFAHFCSSRRSSTSTTSVATIRRICRAATWRTVVAASSPARRTATRASPMSTT